MAADPEALYSEVLSEEQQKGVSPAVAEGRAKAARARAEHGSPHPKEPKWWPGAQPHLEGGDGAAPAETEEEPAAEEVTEEEPAAEAAPEPAEEAPAAQPPDLGEQEAPTAPAAPAAPAAETAPQPAAAAPAPAAAATATQLAPEQRPAGVTHGTPGGNRLRPEDSVGTEVQFDAQQAVYRRRKMIDELVASGVPAVPAVESNRARSASPFALLIYIVIFAVAIGFLVGNKDSLAGGGGGEPAPGGEAPAGNSISAANVAFDTETLTFPAGEESELEFTNEDSVPHNVSIYQEEGGENLFEGEVINGGASTTYAIPALEAGTLYFQCDLHPAMNGEVKVE